MNLTLVQNDGIHNITRRFDGDGDCCVLTVTWEDAEGKHRHLELKHAEALSAARALWHRRAETDRIVFLKNLIRENRTA